MGNDDYMSPEEYDAIKRGISPEYKPKPLPTYSGTPKEVPRELPKDVTLLSPEEKKKEIGKWNENPTVKANGIKAVDENEENKKNRKIKWVFIFLVFIFVSGFLYLSYNLYYKPNVACGNTTAICEETVCNAGACNCNMTCGACSMTIPSNWKIQINDTTLTGTNLTNST